MLVGLAMPHGNGEDYLTDQLPTQIEDCFYEHDGIYGSPKIHHKLTSEGVKVGVNKVARLMHEQELKARAARIYRGQEYYATTGQRIESL